MKAITKDAIVRRWESSERPLFVGSLIGEQDGQVCYCAQGDVLSQAGFTDDELRGMTQALADVEVAKVLDISRADAVLLRNAYDSKDGCPQDVLARPERVLGDEAVRILKFWKYLDTLTHEQWRAAGDAARDAAWDAARDAAWAAARDAAWAAARDAARAAVWAAAGAAAWDAAWAAVWAAAGAANEIQGHSRLESLFFLKAFGFESVEALDELPL